MTSFTREVDTTAIDFIANIGGEFDNSFVANISLVDPRFDGFVHGIQLCQSV